LLYPEPVRRTQAGEELDMDAVRSGALTPMFFGSAMSNFGVQLFLDTFIGLASPPGAAPRQRVPAPPLRSQKQHAARLVRAVSAASPQSAGCGNRSLSRDAMCPRVAWTHA